MWIWIVLVIALIILVTLILGSHRVDVARCISPEEGIEDVELTEAYDRISKWPQFRFLRKLIVRKLKKCHPKGVLADIGCGPGYLMADISKALSHISIIGVDISEEMIRRATENLSALDFSERTSFRKGDIHALPFESNSLDFVISTLSLHHWSEPIGAINEIHRVLKTGGQFLLFDLRRDSPRLFYWVIRFAQAFVLPSPMGRENEPTSSGLASYTPSELKGILSATPFKHCSIQGGIFWSFVIGQKD